MHMGQAQPGFTVIPSTEHNSYPSHADLYTFQEVTKPDQ